jgi:translation initiation factor IF-1
VAQLLPDGLYAVRVGEAHTVVAHRSTQASLGTTRLLVGDRVMVELSPYDSARGRIISRKKQ